MFRFVGAISLVFGLFLGLTYLVNQYWFYRLEWDLFLRFLSFYPAPLTILGFVLFATSQPLARWICFDFEQ